jgi:hypothetical protein
VELLVSVPVTPLEFGWTLCDRNDLIFLTTDFEIFKNTFIWYIVSDAIVGPVVFDSKTTKALT